MKKKAFLSAGEAARALGVSVKTIQRWDKAGLLPVIRTATNQRRIPADAIHALIFGQGKAPRCAIYARVSSAKQEHEGHLTRQAERLRAVVSVCLQIWATVDTTYNPIDSSSMMQSALFSWVG